MVLSPKLSKNKHDQFATVASTTPAVVDATTSSSTCSSGTASKRPSYGNSSSVSNITVEQQAAAKNAALTESLIGDDQRQWAFLDSNIDWKAVSEIASKSCYSIHDMIINNSIDTTTLSLFIHINTITHTHLVPIITKYTYRTNGTCQTPRIPGIGWSYFGADPEWGHRQSMQLKVKDTTI